MGGREGQNRQGFFVSYAGADRAWAEWIAWQLHADGYPVVVQPWHFRPGSNFVEEMNRALEQCERTIVVLSPAYLKSAYARDEWTAAFLHGQAGRPRLLVVRIEDVEPPPLLRPLVYIDLVGVEADPARERLLAGVRQEVVLPTVEPGYPGGPVRPAADAPRFPRALPRTWNLPWRRNPTFTGRMELLERLRAALTAATPGPAVVALTGMGGVGKSQLALEYAYRWQADYDRVWWVRAEQPATLLGDYAALAEELELPVRQDPDQGVVMAAVRRWLEHNRRWLLVLDNAEEVATVRPVLPRGGDGGVVITSRNPTWRRDATLVPVEVLERAEAVAFLLERTSQDDATTAGELAEALGDLPLALEQAGAYVDEQGITLASYARQLRTRAPQLFEQGQPADYENTVATTWTASFQAVEQVAPVTANLLWLCAFLGPDAIPTALLQQGADLLPEPLASAAADPDELATAVAPARRYALVRVADGTLSMHRLIQALIREHAEDRRAWAQRAVALLRRAFPTDPDEPSAWPGCSQLLAHVLAATDNAKREGVAGETRASLLTDTGVYLRARAELGPARTVLEQALAVRESVLGPDHADVAVTLTNLGTVLRRLGEPVSACRALRQALAIRERALGSDHPDVARTLTHLGTALRDVGDLPEAEAVLERALAIREAALGPDHPDVAVTLTYLGAVLRRRGEPTGARRVLERALAINHTAFGPQHPKLAVTLAHLGHAFRDLGDLTQARAAHKRALAIRQSIYPPQHPEVGFAFRDLARTLRDAGDLAGARFHVEHAVRIFEVSYGSEHPDTATSLNDLGLVLRHLGEFAAARTHLERALAIREARLGPDHPDTVQSRRDLATLMVE
jgi:tetratricopeptide (TPR) repeat protein